jgi:hypothetical protein
MKRDWVRIAGSLWLALGAGQGLYCAQTPLSVEARIAQTTVSNPAEIPAAVSVRNTGAGEQVLQVWSCDYAKQWTTDNPSVQVKPPSCRKNYLTKITLSAGEAYKRTVVLSLRADASGSVRFRLKFTPEPAANGAAMQPVWSPELTVHINR